MVLNYSNTVAIKTLILQRSTKCGLVLNDCEDIFINQVGRVFANGLGDRGSISGRFISKTKKMVLDTSLLNTQYYKVRIKGKVAPSLTPQCSSY